MEKRLTPLNNLICVTGNGGAGKSIVSLALAHYLSEKKDYITILISADLFQPMLPVFLPFDKNTYDRNISIGDLFLKGFTYENPTNLTGRIRLHPSNNNLGFLGYVGGDNILRYSSDIISNDKLTTLIEILTKNFHADYIIIDCNTNIEEDILSSFAVKNSDKKILVLSPDNKGVSYKRSQEIFKNQADITILNNCYSYSPSKKLQDELNVGITLPHSKQAYEHFLTGDNFNFSDEFSTGIRKLAEQLLKNEEVK